ncbi:sulfatase [Algibacter lectus]|uniref:Arylsulfatase A-like enzyme n=1 Tax=Algibacter lectus TaxID=221126 RepID=A0A4R8MJ81_9FLAO|nr:sulfatase [Algibacter lectus]MWW23311.1 sulfatase-like hydrolase/transferase [Algibacter lectus]TDY64015.1 arylsulfatase A-like enzyme [Algibacter lectus]
MKLKKASKYLVLALTLGSTVFTSCKSEKAEVEPKKPNVLFVLVDDLGYQDLSVMGSDYYETPNIDKIAKSGTIFTNGYATCTVCSPSRASLLTGQFTARHGITQYEGAQSGQGWKAKNRYTKLLPPDFKQHLDLDALTLPEAFKAGGYSTFFAGKWHLGSKEQHSLPTDHGFDVNQGGNKSGGPNGGYFSPFKNPNLTNLPEEKGMTLSMKLAKETSKFIEKNKDTTFLAYLSFYAVHAPIQTSEEKWKKYRDKAEKMGIDENGFKMERVLPARKHQDNPVYAGLIEQVDEALGTVMQTLRDLDLDKNTIIVFTSDNGGVTSGDNFSTAQLDIRGGKGYQWEGGVRIPYFVYVPWMDQKGSNIDVPVSGTDLFPTLLDLAGLPLEPQAHMDGVSLKPLLEGKTIDERPLFWHYPHYGNQGGEPSSIIRKGNWKLIYYWEDLHSELYNLDSDLMERNNVADSNKELTASLKTELLEWLESMNTQYAEEDPLWDEAARKKRLENHRTQLLPRLEKQRKKMLSPDYKPNKDWWGSQVEK